MTDAPDVRELSPPDRTLMGPGPSEVHPRVLRAMATPLLGHLDPAFLDIMNDVQELLRYLFQTDNHWTIPISGTGSAAMESAIMNLVEPGETVLLPSNGYFGGRMAEMADRAGGEVVFVDAPWGEPLDPAAVEAAFQEHDPTVFGFVHGETSTGVVQTQVPELTSIARDHDAYTIVDTVASLGGVEFRTDEWNVDLAYSGAQKCLSCPPGASPLTINQRAMDKVLNRDDEVRTWYLDLRLLEGYWGDDRAYHHTAPISNIYALRESLRLIAEEGLENSWDRHQRMAGAIKAGVEAMGLGLAVADDHWLPTLNAVSVPEGVDDAAVIATLLDDYNLEVASGLGDLAGEILRVGCMGHSARTRNVMYVLSAIGEAMVDPGYDVDVGAGLGAAARRLST
ncbi:MAG: alanine--glyoxylate aminotransferase family protein [Halobacteriales archaeon]|nr:alanine--glyoxylate aminotransferase family protein [Halobacteriales archaeon]